MTLNYAKSKDESYLQVVRWKTLLSPDQLDSAVTDSEVLNLHILVTAGHRVDPTEVGAELLGHADDVELGAVLVLATVHILRINVVLVQVAKHLLPLPLGQSDTERTEGVRHNLTEDEVDCGRLGDLLARAEHFFPDLQLPGNSVVAEVNVGVWLVQSSLGLLQALVVQLVQDVLGPGVQTLHRLEELGGLLQLEPLGVLGVVGGDRFSPGSLTFPAQQAGGCRSHRRGRDGGGAACKTKLDLR